MVAPFLPQPDAFNPRIPQNDDVPMSVEVDPSYQPGPWVDNTYMYHPPDEEEDENKPEKPDKDEVLKRIEDIRLHWRMRDFRMDEDLRFYELKIGDKSQAGNLVIRNIPRAMVDKASRIVGNQPPHYDVTPPKNVYTSEAQKVEDFVRYMWGEWDKRWSLSGYASLDHDMAHYLALRGWLALRIQYDANAKGDKLPLKMRALDPRHVYPAWDEDEGIEYVAHVYHQTVGQTLAQFPDAQGDWTERDTTSFVRCKAYYDKWYYAYYVEEELITDGIEEHDYGFVPWVISIASGSPIRSTEYNTTEWTAEVGPSIFHSIKEAYLTINKLMSMLVDEIERQANPPLLYYFDPNREQQPLPLTFDSGSVNTLLYDRERVEPLSLTPSSETATPLMNMLMEDIDKGGLPSILWDADGASGFQATIGQQSARDALFPIVRAMERSREIMSSYGLELIRDYHDTDVGYFVKNEYGDVVWGETINFATIMRVGTYVTVTYDDLTPQDKVQKANLGLAVARDGFLSRETFQREYLGIDNPEKETEKILSEGVYQDEELMREYVMEDILKRTNPRVYQMWLKKKQMEMMAPEMPPEVPQGAPPGEGMVPGMETGLPPEVMPEQMQGMPGLEQALGGMLGGEGAQRPEGIPGGGALPMRMPLT